MLTNTLAIVLHTVKYGENKLFVDLFSEEFGRITISCPQGGGRRKGLKANIFQPLSIIEVEIEMKPKNEIHPLKDARICYAMTSIPFDPYKLSISLFLAEFLRYALMNEQRNATIFSFLSESIHWLDLATKDYANFHLVFMTRLSRFIGFYPNEESFFPGSMFDLSDGSFTALIPPHRNYLSPADSSVVPILLRLDYHSMKLLRLSRNERNRLVDTILLYYGLHLPNFPELKSFGVLKELF